MSAGYTFLGQVVKPENVTLANAAIVAGIIGVLGFAARAAAQRAANPLVPEDKFSPRTIFELIADFMINLGDSTMGRENRRYLPFIGVLFTYIFIMNLFGLIPGSVLSTDQFPLNFGIALVVFCLYNIWGVRSVGVVNYIKHFLGPVMVIAPFMLIIEIISHAIRPLTLGLRLFGNMTGDHKLLEVMNGLLPYGGVSFVAIPFYVLGTLVSFIQAFIFTMLTMVYIRMAVSHDH